MNKLHSFAIAIAFTVLFFAAGSVRTAHAQTAGKVGIIASEAFTDARAGIARYLGALRTLKAEFAPLETELTTMRTRYETLTKEIEAAVKTGKPDQRKIEEAEKLNRDISFKAQDGQTRFNRRSEVVLQPINREIGAGLEEFAKLKGYSMIFDASKDQNGLLIFATPDNDITKQFIDFFNAKYPSVK